MHIHTKNTFVFLFIYYGVIIKICEGPFAIHFLFQILMFRVCACTHTLCIYTYTCIHQHTHMCMTTYVLAGVGFLICRASTSSPVLRIAKWFPKGSCQFIFPSAVYEVSVLCIFS